MKIHKVGDRRRRVVVAESSGRFKMADAQSYMVLCKGELVVRVSEFTPKYGSMGDLYDTWYLLGHDVLTESEREVWEIDQAAAEAKAEALAETREREREVRRWNRWYRRLWRWWRSDGAPGPVPVARIAK